MKVGISEDSEVLLSWLHLGKKNAHSTPLLCTHHQALLEHIAESRIDLQSEHLVLQMEKLGLSLAVLPPSQPEVGPGLDPPCRPGLPVLRLASKSSLQGQGQAQLYIGILQPHCWEIGAGCSPREVGALRDEWNLNAS